MCMSSYLPVIAIVISCVALLCNALLLRVHRCNQLERRHGEIVQLRINLLLRLRAAHQHFSTTLLQVETAKLCLRSEPDCASKYEALEMISPITAAAKARLEEIELEIASLEAIDTKKKNNSGFLTTLQSSELKVRIFEIKGEEAENCSKQLVEKFIAPQ